MPAKNMFVTSLVGTVLTFSLVSLYFGYALIQVTRKEL